MAVALDEAQVLDWAEFQTTLGRELDHQAQQQDYEEWNYYAPWLAALEALLIEHQRIDPDELQSRTLEILARSNHQHT